MFVYKNVLTAHVESGSGVRIWIDVHRGWSERI